MKAVTTQKFRICYAKLPKQIKELARKNYKIWLNNIDHPSLQFKQVHNTEPIYSARVGISYRVLCVVDGDTAIWFWIGSHSDYDKLLKEF
jgi:mRNA-degrading endonuclease RelE of RelBE toxin-antitoxin system